jgi:Plasmid pRiA4b ORF-3-like protein
LGGQRRFSAIPDQKVVIMFVGYKFTKHHEKCLREQVITADQPGPVLRDFRVLLDFLGSKGVESTGKYNLLPLKFIGELDGRLSRPLKLKLKRPQLRSHPYLQGLNLLLRASGLSRVEGVGSKARLVLDPAMLAQWDQLNPTEQYFNLLEAWLRFGRSDMVGERGHGGELLLTPCLQTWQFLPKEGSQFDPKKPEEVYVFGVGREYYLLALMDLFGLLKVEQPARPVTPWSPAGVYRVPFGDAVCNRLGSEIPSPWRDVFRQMEEQDDTEQDDAEQNDAEQEEGALEMPRFGAWQPMFQPFFPEWRENLKFPRLELREGVYIFRVSMDDFRVSPGEVWRLIAVPGDATLDDLVNLVLRSVKFDDEHLYRLTYRDRLGSNVSALHPAMDEGPWADQILIGTLPMEPGQTMQLLYDFGDSWRFTIKLERIDPDVKKKTPRILESHGKAPEQYPNWD